MRIPLTKYGLPQVVVYPAALAALMLAVGWFGPARLSTHGLVFVEILLGLVLIWALAFFRDPYREPPRDESLLLSPADGTIMDIEEVDEDEFIGGRALRIGIFLSIFNTHINRAPCDARIERITYRRGRYINAMNPLAGKVNESNNLAMVRTKRPENRLLVRQISGAVARRIVCAAGEGQQLTGGEQFGMIKFGARTELYLPGGEEIEGLVHVKDKVKAGLTPLIRYRQCGE